MAMFMKSPCRDTNNSVNAQSQGATLSSEIGTAFAATFFSVITLTQLLFQKKASYHDVKIAACFAHYRPSPGNILNQHFAEQEHGKITERCANFNVLEPYVALSIYPLETVANFRYLLGRILTIRDNDWAAARSNLQKAIKRWATISRVLIRESASPRISAFFYKATIQTILG
jgi:hypothetical protein